MSLEMIRALEDLEKEKKIDREVIIKAIEEAMESSFKRNNETKAEIRVEVNRKTGEVKVLQLFTVVEDVNDAETEISIADARKINSNYEAGDTVERDVTPRNFGRSVAQKAKQVIVQKIKEEERALIYDQYFSLEKDIVSGTVQRVERNPLRPNESTVYIDLGKIEAILTHSEQVPTEQYKFGDRIKAYVLEVKKTNKDPKIMVSRTHPGLVKRLFELEVAEIRQGFVEIKSISREAGFRTKIAVHSTDDKIDPIGACVGQKGQRVQNIVDELRGEKIDIIKWSSSPAEFISSSLSPAKVVRVDVDEDEKSARVVVPDLQLSLAIGKEGQNVRLAAKLTGWKIDIKCESQIRAVIEAELLNFNSNTETTALYDDDDENMSKELEELLSIDNKQPSAPSNLSLEDLFLNLDDIDKNDDKESEDE